MRSTAKAVVLGSYLSKFPLVDPVTFFIKLAVAIPIAITQKLYVNVLNDCSDFLCRHYVAARTGALTKG